MEEARNLSLINNGRKGCLILSTYALRIPKLFKTEAADQKRGSQALEPRAESREIRHQWRTVGPRYTRDCSCILSYVICSSRKMILRFYQPIQKEARERR
jgi:hypothetical protein